MTGLATVVGRDPGNVPRPVRGVSASPAATRAPSPARRGRGRSRAAIPPVEGATWQR